MLYHETIRLFQDNSLFVIVGTEDWGIDVDDVFEYVIAIQSLKRLSLEKIAEHAPRLEYENQAILSELGIPSTIIRSMVE